MNGPPHFLAYFDRRVLCRYRASPDLYDLKEDDMGGEVSVLPSEDDEDEGERPPYFRVRFGFRRLADRRVCLAGIVPDLHELPPAEEAVWSADFLPHPEFLESDPAFERWHRRYIDGSWESEDGPIVRLKDSVTRCCSVTSQGLGIALFDAADNPMLNYPVAENSAALASAYLELYRLVGEGMSGKAIEKLAARLDVLLTSPAERRFSRLKELLPAALVSEVHEPLRACARERNAVHAKAKRPHSCPAFDSFHDALERMVASIDQLTTWIADQLGLSPQACVQREQIMNGPFWPKIEGQPNPIDKLRKAESATGKTIERVEYGECAHSNACHQREAIVFHFTDGSALGLDVHSNASNLESQFAGLKPSMFHTQLFPQCVPSPRRLPVTGGGDGSGS